MNKARSLAKSERRLAVAEREGPGESPRAMAGIVEGFVRVLTSSFFCIYR